MKKCESNSVERYKQQQDQVFAGIAKLLQAMASPVRVKLLHFLSQAPITVEVLAQKIDQSVANTSMHLRKMLSVNLVQVTVQGQNRLYTLKPSVFPFWEQSQQLFENIEPEQARALCLDQDVNWTYDLVATTQMILKKSVQLIDIRPINEIRTNNALYEIWVEKVPFDQLVKKISLLKKNKPLLVICRGKFCALSIHAVEKLREKNFNAFRFPYSWYVLNNELENQTQKKKDSV